MKILNKKNLHVILSLPLMCYVIIPHKEVWWGSLWRSKLESGCSTNV